METGAETGLPTGTGTGGVAGDGTGRDTAGDRTSPAGANAPSRNCFVLGSGRSGTSMLTGVLAGAGYFVGSSLISPRQANPKGFFEDREVNAVNEDLLAPVVRPRPPGRRGGLFRHRTRWGQRWLSALPVDTQIPVTDELRRRIDDLCATRPFCYKDPRFCYTLPAWRDGRDLDPVLLCVFRAPGRTADSIVREAAEARYLQDLHLTRRAAVKVWTQMYRHILERHRHQGEWVFVHYDQVLDGSGLDRIEVVLDMTLPRDFADAALARSTDTGDAGREAAAVYDQLCRLAGYGAGTDAG